MLSRAERAILSRALEQYRPGRSEPTVVGGRDLLKPALRLMSVYRLTIEETTQTEAVTSYTRWVEAVQLREESVYLTFSPHFDKTWLSGQDVDHRGHRGYSIRFQFTMPKRNSALRMGEEARCRKETNFPERTS